ncbi:MAG TPA: multidrug efflux SMR transporter [Acidobacteriota bacterium]|nr:multidrug efflux SMR transporter [Acidobacteriota bacterium]
MPYVYLAIAIAAEVVGTTSLKASEEFTRLLPSLTVATAYSVSFYFLSMVLKSIPVGITYAVWSGLGVVLVALVGAIVYREVPDGPALLGMALIVAGVLIMNVFSSTVDH